MKEVYVIDAIRTPIGGYGGSLSAVRPDDLAAHVIKALIERNPNLPLEEVEDVVFGAANQAGEDNRNVARMAGLMAGLPITTGGVTVNRLCASGLQAIMDASRSIMCGDGSIYIAGGVESMSRAPFVVAKSETAFNRVPQMFDTTIGWRFINDKLSKLFHPYAMGETAENVVDEYNITREEQDDFAYNSQQKYKAAFEAGKFKEEITSVSIPQRKGDPVVVENDEHPKPQIPREKLSKLRAAFKKDGSVTAANSSGVNDGAAALILADKEMVDRLGVKPLAKIKSVAIAGVRPEVMGIGPVPATQKALKRAGLTVEDIDLWELNEAFASQSIACIRDLKLDVSKVNVNGGSIAIGHPLGASGARIATTLLYEMNRTDAKYGIATMCIGVGQGAAVVFEKI